jgi:putative oxidoreductase
LDALLSNRFFHLTTRLILGITFIYASWSKIVSPAEFAKILYGYSLLPAEIINLVAIVLPFVELVCGLALVSGIYTRSSTLIIVFLLLIFIVALSTNLIRGHEFDCGCFSSHKTGYFTSATLLLLRDIVFLALGCHILCYGQGKMDGGRY